MSREAERPGRAVVRQVVLRRAVWMVREALHRRKVAPQAEDCLRRRSRGIKHPVWDFLFTYYSFPPARLMMWVPGIVEAVEDGEAVSGAEGGEVVAWDVPPMTARVRDQARWVAGLCERMLDRPARFGCFGLHEWAMVYGQSADEVRHRGWRLRLGPQALARFVDSQTLSCTHYDAYRFFTPAARLRNQFEPRLESRVDLEHGGCLHANMDLYKWAYRLWPWVGSDLVADAFTLAVRCRALDMRASPYDLEELGFAPITLEKPEGRDAYLQEQQQVSEAAEPLRRRLLRAARLLVGLAGSGPIAGG